MKNFLVYGIVIVVIVGGFFGAKALLSKTIQNEYNSRTKLLKQVNSIKLKLHFTTNPIVVLHTNQGDIKLELYPKYAPYAVENFITHVKNGYYNGLIFHRVIKDFMIQSGDPTGTGRGGKSIWGVLFKDEFYKNIVFDKEGVLAMANAGFNTNASQFFITTKQTLWLNGRHTIFGHVIEGMDVVHKIESVKTTPPDQGSKPLKDQKIIKAYVQKL